MKKRSLMERKYDRHIRKYGGALLLILLISLAAGGCGKDTRTLGTDAATGEEEGSIPEIGTKEDGEKEDGPDAASGSGIGTVDTPGTVPGKEEETGWGTDASDETGSLGIPEEEPGLEVERIGTEDSKEAEDGRTLFLSDFYYPLVHIPENLPAEEKINAVFSEQKAEEERTAQEYKELAESNYNTWPEEDRQYWGNYARSNDFIVTCNNLSVLGIKELSYSFAGGVHPNSQVLAWNFDVSNGEKVEWEAMAAEPEAFQAFLKERLLSEIKTGQFENGDLMEEGLNPDYEETITEQLKDPVWYVTDEDLIIVFNEYVLAAYAAGILEFEIPLSDCEDYFSEYGKQLLQLQE